MRHGSANRRSRNRGKGGQRGGSPRMQVYDSNGPDVRIRGTAHQVAEKYEALAKDCAASGDTTVAESYLQHAEHYHRIIASWGDNDDAQSKPRDNANQAPAPNQPQKQDQKQDKEDDLSLPASILGGDAKAERTPKAEAETTEA